MAQENIEPDAIEVPADATPLQFLEAVEAPLNQCIDALKPPAKLYLSFTQCFL